jgi:mRNA interferase RelE/StbE
VSYEVVILPRARKELDALPAQQRLAAEIKIETLHENPRPVGCKKMTGREGWRIRTGDYRIIYKIDDGMKIVTVVNVGHRREIYR